MATTLYSTPIQVSTALTLKFVAVDEYGNVSEIQSQEYHLPLSGVSNVSLNSVVAAAVDGAVRVTGISATAYGALTSSIAVATPVAGISASTFSGLTRTSEGRVPVIASASADLETITVTVAGLAQCTANTDSIYSDITATSTAIVGAAPMSGASVQLLAALEPVATGVTQIRAASSNSFATMVNQGIGLLPVNGTSSKTLAGVSVSEKATVTCRGHNTTLLSSVAGSAAAIIGDPILYGATATTLDSIGSTQYANAELYGQAIQQVAPILSIWTIIVTSSGTSEKTLAGLSSSSSGYIGELLTLLQSDTTCADLTCQAVGTVPVSGRQISTLSLEGTPMPRFGELDVLLADIITGFVIPSEHVVTKVFTLDEEPRVFRA